MTRHSTLRIHAALTLVAILFSLNYIISKLAMNAFTPLVFAYLRIVGSALVLNLVLREHGAAPLSRADHLRLIGYSILGVVINQSFFLGGLALTSAHVAAILITTIPIFTLAAAIILGRERATALKIAGMAVAAAGALVVLGGEGLAGAARKSLIGDLLIVANCLSYGLYLVLSKPAMARLSARRVIGRMFGMAAIAMLPFMLLPLIRERWSTIPIESWMALLVVIAGPTVAAYLINAWALAHAESSLVAAYTYLQPVFTVFLAAIFLHESIRSTALAAGLLIFAGVYLSGRPAPPAARPEAVPGSPE